MQVWSQFAVVAAAHFLALLSPGPDFFLILRSAMQHGARQASGVCAGIALANAVFIAAALSGITFAQASGPVFLGVRWAGCAYLAWIGWCSLRPAKAARQSATEHRSTDTRSTWRGEFRAGFLSAMLNPKNSLFYASLFSLVVAPTTPTLIRCGYGLWMTGVVLLWDLAIAWTAGHPALAKHFVAHTRKIECVTGAVLLTIAGAIAVSG